MAKYKIWWQSSMKEGGFPVYAQKVVEHTKKVLSPDFEIEFHGLPYSVNEQSWHSIRLLNEREATKNILTAKDGGYAAFVYGCYADPAIVEAREILDIPVFGMCETSLHWAQYYGKHPAILHYSNNFYTKDLPRLLGKYGMENNTVPTPAFEIPVEQLDKALDDPQPVIELAMKAARQAVENGADIILPGCGILNLVLAENGVTTVPGTGVTVMDVTALMAKVAEMGIVMQEQTGLVRSNHGYFAKPRSELIEEARNGYF